MSTKRRVWFEGATYHITARGNRKEEIFRDKRDYNVYLNIMEESIEYYKDYNYKILSYCLMSNHIHFIIETDIEPLGLLIARSHSVYTRYFNRKYDYVGHLFQGRYFSELIKDEKQLLDASRYVHLNPVKAQIVESPECYKWSSYAAIIGIREVNLVDPKSLLKYFYHGDISYKEFVESGIK